MKALSIKNLEKTYKNGVKALKGIDLEVKEGDFFGLIGPNGAGKTTIIGIITSLVNKSSGKVIIYDKDIDKEFSKAKRYIGVVPQEMNFNIFEKVKDIVIDQAGYYGLNRKLAKERAEYYLKKLGLWDKRDHISNTLSGGMKRRLMIARSLVHEPKMLILDEPTAGVDVQLRHGMWEFLTQINKKGKTIILTSHYLEEVERLCNKIAIINKGNILENTTKKELLKKIDTQTYILNLKNPIKEIKSDYKIKKIDELTIEVELSKDQDISQLFKLFEKEDIKITSMTNKSNRLEELFVKLVREDEK